VKTALIAGGVFLLFAALTAGAVYVLGAGRIALDELARENDPDWPESRWPSPAMGHPRADTSARPGGAG